MGHQLSIDDLLMPKGRPSRAEVPGAFNVYVAPRHPLPVVADSPEEAAQKAAVVAGTDVDHCMALPAREGDWSDRLMAVLGDANRRAEADLQNLRAIHAEILGVPIEKLDERVAADEAERKSSMPARPARSSKGAVAKSAGVDAFTSRLDDRQRELLALVRVEGNVAIYTGTERIPDWPLLKRVVEALGGKWRAKKGWVFPDDIDAQEKVRLAQETGEVLDPRKADFFPTPAALAERVVALAALRPGAHVLEPSAGRGALARAVIAACPAAFVTCVEALPDNADALERDGFAVHRQDFTTIGTGAIGPFDSVVMNPPFGGRADIRHVRHALGFVRPGGSLVAVMSGGVAYREDRMAVDFRSLVEANEGRIEPNPDGSFLESGTGVRTVTVVMRRAA